MARNPAADNRAAERARAATATRPGAGRIELFDKAACRD